MQSIALRLAGASPGSLASCREEVLQDTLPFAGSHGGDRLGIFVQYFVIAPINLVIMGRIAAESGGGI
jgi:hypothetical protein